MGVMGEQWSFWSVVEEEVWRKGPWTSEEDKLLIEYVNLHGEGRWNSVARLTGLKRNGKSCRLRWVNYLRPDLKRGQITPNEESIIIELHARWGNRWSTIARSLPGRTDNEIKNYWRTHFKKKEKTSFDTDNKSKVRLLRKQQFREQQLQHQQQMIQTDMKKTMPLVLVENETKSMPFVPQMRQEVEPPCANIIEDQSLSSHLFNGYYGAYINEIPNEANNLWDSLWNLDDIHRNLGVARGANKGGLMNPNLVTPFY